MSPKVYRSVVLSLGGVTNVSVPGGDKVVLGAIVWPGSCSNSTKDRHCGVSCSPMSGELFLLSALIFHKSAVNGCFFFWRRVY